MVSSWVRPKGLVAQEIFLDINIKMKEFEKLGLSQELLTVLKEKGFEKPSEIQEKAIPVVLKGKDLLGGSATGSGKTLVFAAPIIENLNSNKRVQALILVPTRELAEQVSDSIKEFSKNKRLSVVAIYGGVSIEPQMRRLATADVVVGTPGRILDHMRQKTLNLSIVKFLVLDEVDRMFDMGFSKDVEKIISQCPKDRQTMLFSATISNDIDYLANKYTKNPEEISVESYLDASKLKQIYYDVENSQKFSLLVHLLKEENADLVMVFCSTRRNADFVADNLTRSGISAKAIHGGLDQNKRLRVLKEFHGKGVGVLVCTDVAARGLDIKGVSHIYNYDLPTSSSDYIHRIGRTARAGEEGIAISLLSNRDYENFSNISRDSSLKILQEDLPRFDRVGIVKDFERPRFGGQGDRGGSFGRSRSFGGQGNRNGSSGNRGNFRGPRRPDNRSGSGPRGDGGRNFRGGSGPKREGSRNFGNKSFGNRSFGNNDSRPRRDGGKSFGDRGDSRPKREGSRSFGNKDRDSRGSSSGFSRKPQRNDRNRSNTRNSGNRNRSRR